MISNKKGLSVVIGYVLLVVAVLSMSIIVYTWMKSYVPKDAVECPDGVAVYVKNLECNGNVINFTLNNNGRFNVGGFFIKATNSSVQEVATIDLSSKCGDYGEGAILFAGGGKNNLNVGHESELFECNLGAEEIYILEITLLRYDEESGRDVSCNNARVREIFEGGCNVA